MGVDDPPRNSGLCNLASDDLTPKWAVIISIYLAPPLAFLSSHSCNLNALLKSFIEEAVAIDKSANKWLELSISKYFCWGKSAFNAPVWDDFNAETPSNVNEPIGWPVELSLTYVEWFGSFCHIIGASVPNGIVASGPLCVQGKAEVK
jgi:hypothetical protein